jgi:hypothetical protein
VRAGSNSAFSTVNGTNAAVPRVFVRPVARGSYLRESDVDTRRRVAVIGPELARVLFDDGADPLGRNITVGGVRFRVIGVFESVGGAFGSNRDTEVHIPVTTAQRLFGDERVDALAVKAPSTEAIDRVSDTSLAYLAERYPDEEFSAVTQDQILGTVGRILGLLTTVLAAIAAISLLVGGVGVSNIMLVSVRERTREIGPAQGGRRPHPRHHAAVPHRGGPADDDRRRPGHRHRRRLVAGAVGRDQPAARPGHLVVARAGVRGERGGGRLLRRRPGAAGGQARPRRRAAHGVTQHGAMSSRR